MDNYDVVVIGGGPGGYVAAIRCAQLGMKTACVEKWQSDKNKTVLGGTCLNVGCIPSKALLDSSHHFEDINKHAKDHGISVENAQMDVSKMLKRKDKIVQILTMGVAGLFKKHNITLLEGTGSLRSNLEVVVKTIDGQTQTVNAKKIIIATGSIPAVLPPAPVDNDQIVDSTGALSFAEVPETLGVIGAGVIGLELGSVWRRLGSKVTVIEAMDEFMGAADQDIAKEAQKNLIKQGLDIQLGAKMTSCEKANGKVKVQYDQKGESHDLEVDKLIVAIGRKPNTEGLNAEQVGLKIDQRGFIETDDQCRTNLENVFAIGDVIHGPMLAHKAMEEGVAVAELIDGQKPDFSHDNIPWVVYTWPEIAWVGKTEQQLKAEGRNIRIGSFPFAATGRARAMNETAGLIKMIGDAETDELLGVHIFGPNASELVSEAVLAMSFEASTEDIARTVHAHPTLSEAMHEASLSVDGRTLHL
ncbi:MAG: dihydrolipoyl dehydrogenase [Gammaproteobacteria bacterium]